MSRTTTSSKTMIFSDAARGFGRVLGIGAGHTDLGHHRYYGSSAGGVGERITDTRRGLRMSRSFGL